MLIRYTHTEPAAPGKTCDWPVWLDPGIISHLQDCGINQPYQHQRQLADLAHSGRHCAITTPTASGKTLAYLMPLWAPPETAGQDLRSKLGLARHTALYLAPTKALAHDQRRAAEELGPHNWQVATLDGDSTEAERRFAREQADFILTNPDLVHRSILPSHTRYSRFLSGLRYVIIDEAHRYRGVFGSQVANVIRRLRRVCASYGSNPVFILASATAAKTESWGARLIGETDPIDVVSDDYSPHGQRKTILATPESTTAHDAADLMAKLIDDGYQVLTFVASRVQAELISARAQQKIQTDKKIASYRSGYLAEDRRAIERDLSSGVLSGVAATNALELGVDISGLDVVIIAGFPGTVTAFRQQSGRAGRSGQNSLVVMIAKSDPLDTYLIGHPELLFDAPAETTVLNPENPHVLGPQLAAAAQEIPLTREDERWFGSSMTDLADQAVAAGLLRKRPNGWFWIRADRAVDSIDLRGAGGRPLDVIDEADGRIIGVVDQGAADRTVHPGAIYLHQGEQWLVNEYLPDEGCALVERVTPRYYTQAKVDGQLEILEVSQSRVFGAADHNVQLSHGQVKRSEQVIGYLRRDAMSGEVWDETALDLPVRSHITHAVWWTIPDELVADFNAKELAGAAHGLEHTAIGLLPLFASCDRWDIGGLSTIHHPDTDACTIFVYDGAPGGAGFAEYGYRVADDWLAATRDRLASCDCEDGCPSCVVSPKCGNANQMLDKAAALKLANLLLQ